MEAGAVKRSPDTTEAWILGSGMPALASAIYLIKNAKLPPQRVHILDHHLSLRDVVHTSGDSIQGYDQFGGFLPAPVGAALSELLAFVPSPKRSTQSQSLLDEIRLSERDRSATQNDRKADLVVKRDGGFKTISPHSSMRFSHRWRLAHFLLKCERQLGKKKILDYFPDSFFQSSFWAIWSIQFGFQPWHSAVEFRRALHQYLYEFDSLRILRSLDITGYYQFEHLFAPIYLHLVDLGVDYQFNVQTRAINITQMDRQQRMVTKLNYSQNGLEQSRALQQSDIAIISAGSTSSGCYLGANDCAPRLVELDETQNLDENWSLWLELANKVAQFGNPYNYCTRSRESILESFTITTKDLEFFDKLNLLSSQKSGAGTMIRLLESHWKLNICVPLQPVFNDQSSDQHVFWGYASSPLCEGNYVRKAMVHCTGSEILSELITHLHIYSEQLIHKTITIPRVMPRMTSHLLPHNPSDRPNITPKTVANIGMVGQFVDMPYYTTADISYSVRSARIAVSRLMGCSEDDNHVMKRDWQMTMSNIFKLMH